MRKYFLIAIVCVSWAAVVPPARAQWICNVTDSGTIGQNYQNSYWYTALSCNGNNAVAAADVIGPIDTLGGVSGYYLSFLLSKDGGASWNVKNQGLPRAGLDHQPIVTYINQIDSLNIVAFGDSNLLVRTTDGGATWHELTSPSKQFIGSISFSDAMHGMLVAPDTTQGTFVTSDGGANWSPVPFTRPFDGPCHDYGNGMYRIFSVVKGIVYTTRNNWGTVDSTGPIIRDTSAHEYLFVGCSFGASDTMFSYGYRDHPSLGYYPYIGRSTDGGEQWTTVYDGDTSSPWNRDWVAALSDISRDTIVAAMGTGAKALWSTDGGETWRLDTLLLNDRNFIAGQNFGIGCNEEGELLGAYTQQGAAEPFLLLGKRATAVVNEHSIRSGDIELFPNPATTSITLTDALAESKIHLFNILGREVFSDKVPIGGAITLHISLLPPGLYFISDGISKATFVKK